MVGARAGLVRWILLVGALQASQSPCAEGGPAVIDPEVRELVPRGRARVIVELRLARNPGAPPAGAEAIAAVQRSLTARLVGTHAAVARRYTTVPLLALEIDASALAVLERSGDLVVRARPDAPLASGAGQ